MKTSYEIFFILYIIFSCVISFCNGFTLFPKLTVTITNDIGPGVALTIHCKSKDDDLGEHVLQPGQNFMFRFRPNWTESTIFTCSFKWSDQLKLFDIWTVPKDQAVCTNCNYSIKASGPCRSGDYKKKFDKCFPWNK
ncbi:unnamed protein product [Cochlearia groenlandica]